MLQFIFAWAAKALQLFVNNVCHVTLRDSWQIWPIKLDPYYQDLEQETFFEWWDEQQSNFGIA